MITRLPFREKDKKKKKNKKRTKPNQTKAKQKDKARKIKNGEKWLSGVFFMELVFQYQH